MKNVEASMVKYDKANIGVWVGCVFTLMYKHFYTEICIYASITRVSLHLLNLLGENKIIHMYIYIV